MGMGQREHQRPGVVEGTTGPPACLAGRYRIGERLGEGSMGIVYSAHDDTLDRTVAIKFLSPERIMGGEASARFLREARAVARLSHPHIITLHDVGREGPWHYLVLEYIPGRDLHALMVERGGPLPVRETLHAIRGTLEALVCAHGQGIVHRDIKPENIMVTPDGQVKVTDFGLALARGDVRLTQEGVIVGTLLYLAPEAVTGAPADRRADLYAVGAVTYELLTGRPPFASEDPMAIISQILNAPVTPPRSLDLSIPPQVERVVVRLLAKDPGDRYGSAEEVLAALPAPAEAPAMAPAAVEKTTAQRASLSLLERIVRSSSTAHPRRERPTPTPEEETLLTLPESGETAPPHLTQELLVHAALEDTVSAVEAERRRLAGLLHRSLAEPLNLLLSQANAYEQTLGANPTARMAVSVLASLARQTLQQVRDMESNLHPTILETLGLEPALEALASQAMRVHGLRITLALERMREQLPPQVELALFRAAQDALDRAIRHAHASQVTIQLERRDEQLTLRLADNGIGTAGGEALRAARQRIEQLGGTFETGIGPHGGLELAVGFVVEAPVELTPREMDVIQLLAEGLSNKEIAQLLFISPRTVNFHLDNIYSKLGVSSRTEAAIYALRHGWARRPATYPG
jgi:serine/threonine protein kinase/DNA-binding NarL/FixJ family response regulator